MKEEGRSLCSSFCWRVYTISFQQLDQKIILPNILHINQHRKILWPDIKASEGYARCNLAKKLLRIHYAATDPLPTNSSASA